MLTLMATLTIELGDELISGGSCIEKDRALRSSYVLYVLTLMHMLLRYKRMSNL